MLDRCVRGGAARQRRRRGRRPSSWRAWCGAAAVRRLVLRRLAEGCCRVAGGPRPRRCPSRAPRPSAGNARSTSAAGARACRSTGCVRFRPRGSADARSRRPRRARQVPVRRVGGAASGAGPAAASADWAPRRAGARRGAARAPRSPSAAGGTATACTRSASAAASRFRTCSATARCRASALTLPVVEAAERSRGSRASPCPTPSRSRPAHERAASPAAPARRSPSGPARGQAGRLAHPKRGGRDRHAGRAAAPRSGAGRGDHPRLRGRELFLMGVLKGAVFFVADLMRHIDLPCELDFMAVSSYGSLTDSSGVVRILKDLDSLDRGQGRPDRRGHRRLRPHARLPAAEPARRNPRSLEVCALLVKPARARSTCRSATSASRSRTGSWSATASTSTSATATCPTWPRSSPGRRAREDRPGRGSRPIRERVTRAATPGDRTRVKDVAPRRNDAMIRVPTPVPSEGQGHSRFARLLESRTVSGALFFSGSEASGAGTLPSGTA